MKIGQHVRVTSARGPLTGLTGRVEENVKRYGRLWTGVRFDYPYHEALFYFKVWEISREEP